jgi:chromosome segregation ATPase
LEEKKIMDLDMDSIKEIIMLWQQTQQPSIAKEPTGDYYTKADLQSAYADGFSDAENEAREIVQGNEKKLKMAHMSAKMVSQVVEKLGEIQQKLEAGDKRAEEVENTLLAQAEKIEELENKIEKLDEYLDQIELHKEESNYHERLNHLELSIPAITENLKIFEQHRNNMEKALGEIKKTNELTQKTMDIVARGERGRKEGFPEKPEEAEVETPLFESEETKQAIHTLENGHPFHPEVAQ